MRKQHSLFGRAAVLVMALGAMHAAWAGHAVWAGEIEAPAPPPAWLTDDPLDPSMADDGGINDGDMRLRSTGLCRAEYDPRSNKRVYACEHKTSEACVEAGTLNIALTGGAGGRQYRYLCPAPNE